ncbi:hypothetical protein ACJA88_008411 [Fusarium oxysporum]
MRFTSIFVAGAFATMAAAQSKTASVSPAQQSQLDCLDACDAGDVKCQSYCITDCIANNYWKTIDGTPQETGAAGSKDKASSAAESAASKATGTASDEDSTATASASESDATATDASETASGSASGTASGSAAQSSETGNAATALVGGVSLLGLVAAVFAL